MPKKLALFILGFMLAVGAFLLYQYVSGARPGGLPKAKLPPTSVIESLPPAYEERDQDGNLVYLIRASKAPEPILDEKKQPLPGQYRMENPEATFYQVSGRIIRITAETCKIVLDQAPRTNVLPGAGAKLKEQFNLRSGELSGNVRLYISGQNTPPGNAAAGPAAKDPFEGGARIYFDGPVRYDRTQDQLNSTEGVHIRSNAADYDGNGLKLAINQQARRIDFMRIEKGKEIVLRGMAERVMGENLLQPATAPVTRPAATRPDKAATIYRLALAQGIHAAAGDNAIDAETLQFIFQAVDDSPEKPAAGAPAAAPGAPNTAEPIIPDMSGGPGPIAAATDKDVHILWSGPFELRPLPASEANLVDSKDILLEATGTAANPLKIVKKVKDGVQTVMAGRLWYHGHDSHAQFDPGAYGRVFFSETGKGSVECMAMTFLGDRAVFKGPGMLTSYPSAGEIAGIRTVKWQNQFDLVLEKFIDNTDPKNPKTSWQPRYAVLDNAVVQELKRDPLDPARKVYRTTDFAANALEIWIANFTVAGKQKQAAERVLAKGRVAVNIVDTAAREQSTLQAADSLEITSTPSAEGPIFSRMTAIGGVSGSRTQDKATITKENPNPAPDPEKHAITAPHLIADLKPKAKSATRPATAPAGTADAFDTEVEVSHFLASNGVRIEITPPPSRKRPRIIAIADNLEADALPAQADPTKKDDKQNFKATLHAAANANTPPVRLAYGADYLEARTVLLDSETLGVQVPGAGIFDFTLPPPKPKAVAATVPATLPATTRGAASRPAVAAAKPPAPTPMHVEWQKGMNFDGITNTLRLLGPTVALVPGEHADQGKLTAQESLTVQLKRVAATQPAGTARSGAGQRGPAAQGVAAQSVASASPDSLDVETLELDWIEAVGNVVASGAQFDGNRMTREIRFSTSDQDGKPGRLRYYQQTESIEIPGPGALVVKVDLPPGDKKSDQMDTNGTTVFGWKESLVYDGLNGVITLKKNVDFIFVPRDGFNFARGALPAPAARGRAPAPANAQDRADLTTDMIVATLAKPSGGKAAPSPIGLDKGEISVSTIQTSGGTTLRVGGYTLGGDALHYDDPKQKIVIVGKGEDRVIIQNPNNGGRTIAPEVNIDLTADKFQLVFPKGFQALGG